jgi:hypothetical protein
MRSNATTVHTRVTRSDTPAAKRASSTSPNSWSPIVEEEYDDNSPTIPIPTAWFQDHDSLNSNKVA